MKPFGEMSEGEFEDLVDVLCAKAEEWAAEHGIESVKKELSHDLHFDIYVAVSDALREARFALTRESP